MFSLKPAVKKLVIKVKEIKEKFLKRSTLSENTSMELLRSDIFAPKVTTKIEEIEEEINGSE